MMMCETLLKDGYDFLLKFQTYDVMIHLLYQTYRSLLLDVLMEIVEPAGLKYSRGSSDILSGKDMKKLVLETKEERKARKEEEIRKQDDVQSKKKIGKEKVVPPRRAQLLPVEKILLSKEVSDKIKDLVDKHENAEYIDQSTRNKRIDEAVTKAKEIKFGFHKILAKKYQHYLPLDNDFLRYLSYLCPKKFVEDISTEAYIVKIEQSLPMFDGSDTDDLRREVRKIRADPDDCFGESLKIYKENFASGFKLKKGMVKNLTIDIVWRDIIENDKFPNMSKLLRASFSIFNSTASAEGAVNDTRNVLRDRSHRLINDNLNSRKVVKSAIRASGSKCCYDYDISNPKYHENWKTAWGSFKESKLHKEQSSDEEDELKNSNDSRKQNDKKKLRNLGEKA